MAKKVTPFSVQKSCDGLVTSVRKSSLNYSMQETPYSLYITVRKSFSKLKTPLEVNEDAPEEQCLENLKLKLKSVEETNKILQQNLEVATNDSVESYKTIEKLENEVRKHKNLDATFNEKDRVTEQMKQDKDVLQGELETAEKNWKNLNKLVKVKDKEIYDLQKENAKVTVNLETIRKELKDLTLRVNKDKKDLEKKQRKQEKMFNLQPNQIDNLECTKCDVKTKSMIKLKEHDRICHLKSIGVQTSKVEIEEKSVQCTVFKDLDDKTVQTEDHETKEQFEKYPCHYCNINIANEYHLNEHRIKCRGTLNLFTEVGLPPPNPYGYSSYIFPGFSSGFCPPHNVFGFRRSEKMN